MGPLIVATSTRVSFFRTPTAPPGGTCRYRKASARARWPPMKGSGQVEEVSNEPLYRDRVCGIDIGKAGMAATIRVPSEENPARRASETREFATTRRGVLALADWLRCWQVPAVVMEATSDYWKGPFYRLEAEGLECVLADPKQVKHLPGRPKRDTCDSAWLAACFERGAVRPCFVATPEFRVIRLHTRYRRDLTGERTREKNRAEKLLESAAIKISSVVTDLHGVTGRDIMDHLIAGERNPKVLAQFARTRARRKITELEHALEGAEFFTPEHAALLKAMLERIDGLDAQIARLSQVIERLLAPHPRAPGLLGRPHPAGRPVRQARRPRPAQEGQQVPRRHHRRDRRVRRAHPDPRRCALPEDRPPPRQGESMRGGRQHPAEGLPQAAVQSRHAP